LSARIPTDRQYRWGTKVSDVSTYRRAASECLEIAAATKDADTRTRLIMLAGKFFDLADHGDSDGLFRTLLDEFNEYQMRK
jgi:hypothetical protein